MFSILYYNMENTDINNNPINDEIKPKNYIVNVDA